MKKRLFTLVIIATLCMTLSVTALAAGRTDYVFDDAGLLDTDEREELNDLAREISEEYECGIYIMTVYDFTDLDFGYDVFDATWNVYHQLQLGYGKDRDGVILLLSMRERDYALFVYGDWAEYAFNEHGQIQLEDKFLDDFGDDEWYDGFRDYLDTADRFLAKAEEGEPVRESAAGLTALLVFFALVIAAIVTAVCWAGMRTARLQRSAGQYAVGGGLQLSYQHDRFTHNTYITRTISSSSSGSSGGRVGGGGSGRSGKF